MRDTHTHQLTTTIAWYTIFFILIVTISKGRRRSEAGKFKRRLIMATVLVM